LSQTPITSTTSRRLISTSIPRFSAAAEEEPDLPSMSPAENEIADILKEKLSPTELLVQDVSGGCGSMYAIDITSPAFKGQTILKQQRMVNAALGDLVKGWHGVQIRTKVSA
jgi:stress-induced morphogen